MPNRSFPLSSSKSEDFFVPLYDNIFYNFLHILILISSDFFKYSFTPFVTTLNATKYIANNCNSHTANVLLCYLM